MRTAKGLTTISYARTCMRCQRDCKQDGRVVVVQCNLMVPLPRMKRGKPTRPLLKER